MRSFPRLDAVNAAIVALYFAPVWGGDGLRALISPFHGFDDRVHAVAASYLREVLDLGLTGLMHTSSVLAGLKFVIAIGFLAYLIDFARALVVGRDVNRETLDVVLVFAAATLMLWAWPALGSKSRREPSASRGNRQAARRKRAARCCRRRTAAHKPRSAPSSCA